MFACLTAPLLILGLYVQPVQVIYDFLYLIFDNLHFYKLTTVRYLLCADFRLLFVIGKIFLGPLLMILLFAKFSIGNMTTFAYRDMFIWLPEY